MRPELAVVVARCKTSCRSFRAATPWVATALAAGLLAGGARPVAAEQTTEVERLRAAVEQLERTVQQLQGRIAALEKGRSAAAVAAPAPPAAATTAAPAPAAPGPGTSAAAASAPESPAPATTAPPPADELKPASGEAREPAPAPPPPGRSLVPDYNTVGDEQAAAPRADNVPIDPSQKGFIPIPGTQSKIRFGGSARVDSIYDFADNGNPNLFIPSSIPVPGQAGSEGGPQFTLEAKGTRLTFELLRPLEKGDRLRVYYENDFFGDSSSPGMNYRLRHLYGQAWNVLVGQTFSAFMNVDAWPDTIDYQGPNAMINTRQPQIRYTLPLSKGSDENTDLMFSAEQPTSQVNASAPGFPPGSTPVTPLPDAVVGYRWEAKWGHLQLSGLAREIATESGAGEKDSVFGWGFDLSGAVNVFKGDKISYQVAWGQGMARYVNDLSGLNMDAGLDSDGSLKAIPVFAPMVGYMHLWSESWRSTASWGHVGADPVESLGPYAVENTTYASVNLIWQPKPSFRVGLEYLHGWKETLNGETRGADRLDFVIKYDLVK